MTHARTMARPRKIRIARYSRRNSVMRAPCANVRAALRCAWRFLPTVGFSGGRKMAGVTGLEPATSGVTGQHSNQLSYTPETRRHV